MIGITLSPDQIRRAPAEVRRWIEQEIAAALGLPQAAARSEQVPPQLAACSHEELAAVLGRIQGLFPVLNVFFELGRKGIDSSPEGLQVFRLADIQHHTRLQRPEQVIACLDVINEAVHRVRGSAAETFYGLDDGYCLVAAQTQQNIRRLWLELVGGGDTGPGAPGALRAAGSAPEEPSPADPRPDIAGDAGALIP